ncbi:MAG: sortase [Actinobacteria bacterium]|nr:sortase [Actinomycetota bacterium]
MTALAPALPVIESREDRDFPSQEEVVKAAVPPLGSRQQIIRAALLLLAVIAFSLIVELLLVSPLQQRAAQQRAFDSFRKNAAAGTAPLAAGELKGKKGAPVAYLEARSIGLHQVILEGTDGGDLFKGPGHRRDTPIPGQAGTSVILGRQAAFGGPFDDISNLRKDAVIRATTGAGVFDYRVIGVRRSGDPAPPALRAGGGRIVLVTANGARFAPSGLLLVDADLIVPGLGGPGPLFTAKTLPDTEKLMSIDTTTLWRLALWLQALLVVVLAAIWSWQRWNPAKTWIVFLPALLLVGLFTAGEAARLLPNLL